MKTKRRLPLIAVVLLVCPVLLAGGLDKYKNWPDSPQGYFMTKAERAEWKANVKTDADAEAFIKSFLTKRPANFASDVEQAAAAADKHLSVARQKGSLTTRGKIVIVLGPPLGFTITRRESKGNAGGSSDLAVGASSDASGGAGSVAMGASVGDMVGASLRRDLTTTRVTDYAFTYKGDALPIKQSKDFMVVVEVNPGTGSDRIVDRKLAARLDDLFEAAANARLAPAAPAK